MNDQYFFDGLPYPALDNHCVVPTSQYFFDGIPFPYLFPLNTAPNNFWLLFE